MTPQDMLDKLIATAEKNNLEHSHQTVIFALFAVERSQGRYLETEWLFAIPNANSHHQVSEGVKSGVPDICLLARRASYLGLWVELKRPARERQVVGKPSIDQLKWQAHLQSIGYASIICIGWEEAVKQIKGYLDQ